MLSIREFTWFLSVVYRNRDFADDFASNSHVPGHVQRRYAGSSLNPDLLPKELIYPPYEQQIKEDATDAWLAVQHKYYDPYHYPLMAENHSGLPETYIFTAHYDPLRDDGFLYARKLQEAGVKVTHYNCPFGWHGILVADFEDSRRVLAQIVEYLKENL